MSSVLYLRCQKCNEILRHNEQAYCADCNIYLMYRAMPILLGMLLLGGFAPGLVRRQVPLFDHGQTGYECSDAINWE